METNLLDLNGGAIRGRLDKTNQPKPRAISKPTGRIKPVGQTSQENGEFIVTPPPENQPGATKPASLVVTPPPENQPGATKPANLVVTPPPNNSKRNTVKVKKPTYYNRTFKHWNKFAESLNPGILSVESTKRINDLGVINHTKILPTDKERELANEAKQQTKPPPKTIDYYNKLYKVKELTQLKLELFVQLNRSSPASPDTIAIDTQLAIAHETAAIKLAKLKFDYDKISNVNDDDTELLSNQIRYALKYGLFGKIITLNKHNNLDRTKSLETAKADLKRATDYYNTLREIHYTNPNKNIVDDLQYAKKLAQHKSNYVKYLKIFMDKKNTLESTTIPILPAVKDAKADVDALIDANQKVLNIELKIDYRKELVHFNTPLSAEQATLLKQANAAMDTLDALIVTIAKKNDVAKTAKEKVATAPPLAPAPPSLFSRLTTRSASATPAPPLAPAPPSLFSRLTTRSASATPAPPLAPATPAPPLAPAPAPPLAPATPATPSPSPLVNIPITSDITDMVKRCKSLMSEIATNRPSNRILLRQLAKHLIILVTLINQK